MDKNTKSVNKDKKTNNKCVAMLNLYTWPKLNNISPNLTSVNYHIMMDKFLEPLLDYYWKDREHEPLEYIHRNLPSLETQTLTSIEISCVLQALCMLCYHEGDKILKISKLLSKKLQNQSHLADNRFFQAIATHLKFYPYMNKKKVEKARRSLEEARLLIGNMEPCEWSGWFYRAEASYQLQCAWLFHNGRSTFKKNARDNFHKSQDHFSSARAKSGSCQYLHFLPLLSLVNIVFLTLQFCWYMFDESSIKAKFASCDIEMLNFETAGRLINQIEQEASSLSKGTIWLFDIQYHILEAKFFLEYRRAQRHKHCGNVSEARCCILCAERLLADMCSQYTTGNNVKLLQQFQAVVSDFQRNLPSTVDKQSTPQSDMVSSEVGSTDDHTLDTFSTQSSAPDTDGSLSDVRF